MTPELNKWIARSLTVSFRDSVSSQEPSLKIYQEGMHRDTNKVKEFLEFRFDGPWYQQLQKNRYKVRIEVNTLVVVNIRDNDPDWSIYRIHELAGMVASIYESGFSVTDDSANLIGCMRKLHKNRDFTKISHFGQIETHTRILQATVETAYEMEYRHDN